MPVELLPNLGLRRITGNVEIIDRFGYIVQCVT